MCLSALPLRRRWENWYHSCLSRKYVVAASALLGLSKKQSRKHLLYIHHIHTIITSHSSITGTAFTLWDCVCDSGNVGVVRTTTEVIFSTLPVCLYWTGFVQVFSWDQNEGRVWRWEWSMSNDGSERQHVDGYRGWRDPIATRSLVPAEVLLVRVARYDSVRHARVTMCPPVRIWQCCF